MLRLRIVAVSIYAAAFAGCSEPRIPAPQAIEGFIFTHSNAEDGLKLWLKSGGSPNAKNNDGASLLYVATGPKGGNQVVKVLLKAGADPNVGRGSVTPLMNAATWANAEAVALLLAAGANPLLKDESGRTAMQQVGTAGGREQSVFDMLHQAEKAARK
jgi:ankyrin repeat protein